MIELKITGCCKRCKYIDLDLREYSIMFDLESDLRYEVRCKHENVCGALLKEKAVFKNEDIQPS